MIQRGMMNDTHDNITNIGHYGKTPMDEYKGSPHPKKKPSDFFQGKPVTLKGLEKYKKRNIK